MLNQVVLTGNLGADPETKYSADGNPIATFNLAFHSGKEKTGWIKIVAFNRLAEIVDQYLHKGARVALVGTLDQYRWETDEGTQKSTYSVIAHNIEFIKTDGRGFETNGEDEAGENDNDEPTKDSDIPF